MRGLPLVEMLKSDEDLKIPAHFVVQVLDRIESWLEINAPEVSARPTDEIWARECFLHTSSTYKLSALAKLASLGLKRYIARALGTTARAGSR